MNTTKGFFYYFRLFCQRTSIRGVPKVENSKQAFLKWFWFIFVLLSFIILSVLLYYIITKYLQYDTIIKSSYGNVTSQDFPEVTICSKRFFDMVVPESRSPFSYLDAYTSKIYSQVLDRINDNDISNATLILQKKYIVSGFFHDQFDFINTRTSELVKNLRKNCTIRKLAKSADLNESGTACRIRAIFNPSYLNCLAFTIPSSFTLNSSKFFMEIKINFARKPENALMETFKLDEYLADNDGSDGYQESRVFIHNQYEYPFDSTYEESFNCKYQNSYIEESVNQKFYQRTVDSLISCRKEQLVLSSFNVTYNNSRISLCKALIIHSFVIQQCGCLISTLPTNNSFHQSLITCDLNPTQETCSTYVTQDMDDFANSACKQSCNLINYNSQPKLITLYSSNFTDTIQSLFDNVDACMENEKNVNACCNDVNLILENTFPIPINRTCSNNNNPPNVNNNVNAPLNSETVNNNNFISKIVDNSEIINIGNIINKIVDISNNNDTVTPTSTLCDMIYIKVQLKSTRNIQVESLIVELSAFLSQMSGMSAFITGFTFTFIAEFLEIILIWLSERFPAK